MTRVVRDKPAGGETHDDYVASSPRNNDAFRIRAGELVIGAARENLSGRARALAVSKVVSIRVQSGGTSSS